MSWAAAAVASAGIVASYESGESNKRAAGHAANVEAAAGDKAASVELDQFERSRADQLPWLEAGGTALADLSQRVSEGPGEFEASPGYQFRLDEGNRNLLRNAVATGAGSQSGATQKALVDYGQKSASNEYDNFLRRYRESLNPLQSLAGVGQTTGRTLGAEGSNTSGRLGSIYQGQGRSQAQAGIDQANINTSTLQNISNIGGNYLGSQGNNQPSQQTSGGTSYGQEWDTSSLGQGY